MFLPVSGDKNSPDPGGYGPSVPAVALIYHDVVEPTKRTTSGFAGAGPDRYKLSPTDFAAHLEAVASTGLAVGLVGDGRDGVRLTFDDGGASAVAEIAPALAAYAWLGHFFVPTAHVGTPGFADADGLRALRRAGHLVGAHGHTHRILDGLPEGELREEWRTSRAALEELLGEEVATASVPRGYASQRVLEAAAAAGFRHVFTSEPTLRERRVGGAAVHGRFSVVRTTSPAHVAALCRRSPAARARASGGWRLRQGAKRALGPAYDTLRGTILARR